MARMIPPVLDTRSDGERWVYERLLNDPAADGWIVIHALDVAKHPTQVMGEIDFVVLVPALGVLCLEVKGAHALHVRDGLWYWGTDPTPHKSPFKQAEEGMQAVRDYLAQHCPDLRQVPFGCAVVMPFVTFNQSLPDAHPWQIIDGARLRNTTLAQSVQAALHETRRLLTEKGALAVAPADLLPTPGECALIAKTLRPIVEVLESPRARREQQMEEVKRCTDVQLGYLDFVAEHPRVLVDGLAGTGKTVLAIETARRAVAAGRRTLVVCYNRFLAAYLQRELTDHPLLTVDRLDQYLLDVVGLPEPAEASSDFWDRELPDMALNALLHRDPVFDELIMDEAQDLLRQPYLDVLEVVLKGGLKEGRWRIFGDFPNQAIFKSHGVMPLSDFRQRYGAPLPYLLQRNCRNTKAVTRVLDHLALGNGPYKDTLRPDPGTPVEQVHFRHRKDAPAALARALTALLEGEGRYEPDDIVILSPHRHKCLAAQLADPPWAGRLQPFDPVRFPWGRRSGVVRYTTVWSFKGLEARVVVLTDFEQELPTPEASRQELLYTGVSRALDRVVVVTQRGGPVARWLSA